MIELENSMIQMDDLLDKMAEELQLNETRFDNMINHYEAVKNWIESDETFFKPYKYDVYPHGSVRIRTTVKPIGKDEFDLDIAVHLNTDSLNFTPELIYRELVRRLKESKVYDDILEEKSRCVRLNYAGDFHMDIMPGIQVSKDNENEILISDKKRMDRVVTNPKGYAGWFLDEANRVKESILEKAIRAESIPADKFKNKKPLQRAVQLIKRNRDVYFQDNDDFKTSSIILTTIAGELYNSQNSIFDSIDSIVNLLYNRVMIPGNSFKIYNPVNPKEEFTDKWDKNPRYLEEFKGFVVNLQKEWTVLKQKNNVIKESDSLKSLFGEKLLISAQTRQTETLELFRKKNKLGVNLKNGMLTEASALNSIDIKRNTFFGSN